MTTPHTDQFEEIVKEFKCEFLSKADKNHSWLEGYKIPDVVIDTVLNFFRSKLHHIRQETEKGMMEKVNSKIDLYFQGLIIIPDPMATRESLKKFLSNLESDNSTQK